MEGDSRLVQAEEVSGGCCELKTSAWTRLRYDDHDQYLLCLCMYQLIFCIALATICDIRSRHDWIASEEVR